MKLLCLFLLVASAAAQTIAPSQIRPGSNGQVFTTVGGVSAWGAASGLGPYVPVTGAPSGVVPTGGYLGYGDAPFSALTNATNLSNQPGSAASFTNGGFSWIYIDPSNIHHYLGGVSDLGYLGMTMGVAGTFCGGQDGLSSLPDLLAFNNKGVGTYISFNDFIGNTSGISHISNITNVGSVTGGWSFDTGDITGTSLTPVATIGRQGQFTGSSLSTAQAGQVGTTCTVGGYVTVTIDSVSRKLAYCN